MKIKTKRGARRIRNQRVITRRFVTTDYTGCSYITAGKRYDVENISYVGKNTVYFHVFDDIHDRLTTKTVRCPHLDGHDWRWGVL